MKIGIDARLINETGVGRYIRNLLRELWELDKENEYVIYLPETGQKTFIPPNSRWTVRYTSIHWHSLSEQLILPFLYFYDHLDLLHVPYFTIPVLYPGKIITTVHDLTVLTHRTGKATTLPPFLYTLKWFAYKTILSLGLRRAAQILTVSKTARDELERFFPYTVNKISVTYEGVDDRLFNKKPQLKKNRKPYFLYVGNVYPHKNAEVLINAIALHSNKSVFQLRFVGKEDHFYKRLKELVKRKHLENLVLFEGEVSDNTLQELYINALSLVFPSQKEGFGLPALEALANDCRLIVSDIPIFHELLPASYTTFVPANDPYAWLHNMVERVKQGKQTVWESEEEKKDYFEKFSWRLMAKETLRVYREV